MATKMSADDYMDQRVEHQLEYYENAASKAKKSFYRYQLTIIILGVLIPVLVNFDALFNENEQIQDIVVTVFSVTLAVLTGVLGFLRYSDKWLNFRATEEMLKHEKYLFLTKSSPYEGEAGDLSVFVNKVESIISAEHNKFRSIVEDDKRPVANLDNRNQDH